MKAKLSAIAPAIFFAAAAACGTTPPPPASSGDPLALTTSSAAPPKTADAPTPAASSAAPAASSAPGKAPRAPSAGAPMAVAENDKESTSAYGASGGIVRIAGTGELTVPRNALAESLGFTFGLNTGKNMLKITPYRGQIGDVFHLFIFHEQASNQGVAATSSGPPFVIKLALKGAKTGNLVIATADGAKAKYSIIAPKSVLEADGGNTAVFELPTLPGDAILHLTSAPPTP